MKRVDFWSGALAVVLTIVSTVAIRRLLLVPVFHVAEMMWSTAFLTIILFGIYSQVLKIVITALRLSPNERSDPKALSEAFGAPEDKLQSILGGK